MERIRGRSYVPPIKGRCDHDKGKAIISTSKPFYPCITRTLGTKPSMKVDTMNWCCASVELNGSSPYGSSPVIEFLRRLRFPTLESLNITATDKESIP